MYTSYIGKKFLNIYNEQEDTAYSAEEFFMKIFFPLFFNDEQHLMHVHGSSFFQKVNADEIPPNFNKHTFKLRRLQNDIENGRVSGSIYVGYAAEKLDAVSSGQVTSIPLNITSEEIYSSWLGQALGIGVSGGYVMLINDEDILMTLYRGWKTYRKFLQQNPNVKDKQIETWNGRWISYCLSDDYNEKYPEAGQTFEVEAVQGKIAIPTIPWFELIFQLSRRFHQKESLVAYAYNLSQMNSTLGFIKIYLHEISEMFELQDKIFVDKSESILSDKEIAELGTFYNFRSACMLGSIGLRALEPAKLRECMPKGSATYAQGKDFKLNNVQSYQYYKLYKIWIIAMLNKTELLHIAEKIAASLVAYHQTSTRGKTTGSNFIKEFLETKSVKGFIEKLSDMVAMPGADAALYRDTVKEVLQMPVDSFPLLITLIKFEYNYQNTQKNLFTHD